MKKYGATLHAQWIPGRGESEIMGQWAEDSTQYIITVPPQLRGQIIEIQNALHSRYTQIEDCRTRLAKLEGEAESLLGGAT